MVSDIETDMDQLRSSLRGVVPSFRDRVDRTELASAPAAFYATLFVCWDIAYNVFEREVLAQTHATHMSARARRTARRRPRDLRNRDASRFFSHCVSPSLDMRRLAPPLAAGGIRQPAVTA